MIFPNEDDNGLLSAADQGYRFRVCGYSVPKEGHEEHENEDAFAFQERDGILRVAVADGATESFYSRHWAQLLVDSFVSLEQRSISEEVEKDWIQSAAMAFSAQHPLENLPWHAHHKGALGSHATFAGFAFDLDRWTYRTYQMGDCCLLVSGKKTRIIPKSFGAPLQFTNQPKTVRSKHPKAIPYAFQSRVRSLRSGSSTVFLLTDALADALLLGTQANNASAIATLAALTGKEDFVTYVQDLRKNNRIRNDDTTLVIVELERAAIER